MTAADPHEFDVVTGYGLTAADLREAAARLYLPGTGQLEVIAQGDYRRAAWWDQIRMRLQALADDMEAAP